METKLRSNVFINPYGIKIVKKCVSCKYFTHCMPNGRCYESQGICAYTEVHYTKEIDDTCSRWDARRGLLKAGCKSGNAIVKKKDYFTFLTEVAEKCYNADSANKMLFSRWRWFIETNIGNIYKWWKEDMKKRTKEEQDAIVDEQINRANTAYLIAMEERSNMDMEAQAEISDDDVLTD